MSSPKSHIQKERPWTLDLPFVRQWPKGERDQHDLGLNFWSVIPTGDYAADCAAGRQLAKIALREMVNRGFPQLMQWTVFGMMELRRPRSGVEVGYLSEFGHNATFGFEAIRILKGDAE